VHVEGDQYIVYSPYASLQTIAKYANAITAFLCWFKVVFYLSVVPQFALIIGTMSKAWKGVRSFCFICLIVMYGFGLAFMTTFGSNLAGFRNMGQTASTLLKALLGDFDFDAMVNQHWLMGALLFMAFVFVGVFVTLNLLIAIISDAYAHTEAELSKMEEVAFGKELCEYIHEALMALPVFGIFYRRVRRAVGLGKKRGTFICGQIREQTQSTVKLVHRKTFDAVNVVVVKPRKISRRFNSDWSGRVAPQPSMNSILAQ
jgi:hypothetical protein